MLAFLRTAANRLWLSALASFVGGLAVLAADFAVRRASDSSARLDPSQVNAVTAIAWILFSLATISVALWVLRQFGVFGLLDAAELRHEACVDCHHDYVMPRAKDRDKEDRAAGDVYRVEVRNRILVGLEKVTLVIDSSDPPIEGLEVRMRLMNDDWTDFRDSKDGVTVTSRESRHWTVVAMKEEGKDAHRPFIATVNGPRFMNVGQTYRLRFHAEADGKPIGRGEFQVFYTDQNHMRFRRVA